MAPSAAKGRKYGIDLAFLPSQKTGEKNRRKYEQRPEIAKPRQLMKNDTLPSEAYQMRLHHPRIGR
jgi:hypothetical protein